MSSYHVYSKSYGHEMSEMVYFLHFLLKKATNIQVNLKDLFYFFQKMLWLMSFGITVHEILRVEIKKKITCILKGWYLANGSSESNNPWHFLKELNKTFNIQFHCSLPICIIFWSVKYTFTCQR